MIFLVFYGPSDGPSDGRTDGPSYRDARMHLKRQKQFVTTEYDQNYLWIGPYLLMNTTKNTHEYNHEYNHEYDQ